MKEELGIFGNGCSDKLKRVLSDFGIEKSFGRSVQRFAEHYGWEISASTIMRHTEAIAKEYLEYLMLVGIHPMLSLRVVRANDWWNDFWQ